MGLIFKGVNIMRHYVGNKSVIAHPMKESEYYKQIGDVELDSKNGCGFNNNIVKDRDGYYVIFPSKFDKIYPNGINMWFPKDLFEEFFAEE